MAQRRPITSHPAFVPLVALWFAALLGLGVAVLPVPLLERLLATGGLGALVPLTFAGRVAASGAGAVVGGLLGLALALPLARRAGRDPRPIYAEMEPAIEEAIPDEPVRRPLRVREELEQDFADTPGEVDFVAEPILPQGPVKPLAGEAPARSPAIAEADEGFMILSPQPVHPPRPAPDLQALLDQFDTAIAAFRESDPGGPAAAARSTLGSVPDPVQAFVARQTGAAAPSPLGGRMPDHQAELRAALDKLARAHRKD